MWLGCGAALWLNVDRNDESPTQHSSAPPFVPHLVQFSQLVGVFVS